MPTRQPSAQFLRELHTVVAREAQQRGLPRRASTAAAKACVESISATFGGCQIYIGTGRRKAPTISAAEISAGMDKGLSMQEIASRRGLSRGHVYRVLAQAQQA